MLERHDHDRVVELRLARPPANAMNTELVTAIADGMEAAVGDGAAAIVVSGQPKMFSGGLDVPALLELDEAGIRDFWAAFFRMNRTPLTLPIPVAVAITGHSPAGGAVLAIHCDRRFAAAGSFRIGLNEVQVGLPLSENFFVALRRLVGQSQAQDLAVRGALVDMDTAHRIGLVDELLDADAVVGRAIEWASEFARLPPFAMSSTLQLARADLAEVLARLEPRFAETATRHWFSDETQGAMRAMVEALAKKKRARG